MEPTLDDLPTEQPPEAQIGFEKREVYWLTPIEAKFYDAARETALFFAVQPWIQGTDRRYQTIVVMEKTPDLIVDEFDRQLDKGLRLRGNAGGGPARNEPDEPEHQDADDDRRHDRVVVDRPEAALLRQRLGKEREVVLDVRGRVGFVFCRHRRFLRFSISPESESLLVTRAP